MEIIERIVERVIDDKIRSSARQMLVSIHDRGDFLARSGLKEMEELNKKSKESFLNWFDESVRQFEDQMAVAFDSMNRPILRMGKTLDTLYYRVRKQQRREEKLHEIEVSRMIDEGGAIFEDFAEDFTEDFTEDYTDFESEPFRKAG